MGSFRWQNAYFWDYLVNVKQQNYYVIIKGNSQRIPHVWKCLMNIVSYEKKEKNYYRELLEHKVNLCIQPLNLFIIYSWVKIFKFI